MQGFQPTRSGKTATTLILVGLILQSIEVAFVLVVGALVTLLVFVGVLLLGVALIGVVWVVLVYLYSYRRAQEATYEAARTPTLVFAILSLITFNVISGVLYLIAWVKLGEAVDEQTRNTSVAWGTAPPLAPSATFPGRYCSRCGAPNAPGNAYCSRCGNPLG